MLLYECLTGSPAFPRDTPRGFLARKLDTPPRPALVRAEGTPRSLETLIAWMTAAEAKHRPANTAAVAAVLASLR
jgi:hypothetical protein